MQKLFDDEAQLQASGYLFRITDNGGATCDRFTIVTCDGDYFGSSADPHYALGFFQSGEGIDVQRLSDRVESGEEKDLRWVDLPEDVRRAVMGRLNDGFADWLEAAPAAETRDQARNWQGLWNEHGDNRTPIYCEGGAFFIRDDERDFVDDDKVAAGPFATFADAIRYMLPQDYDLSGPEYHTTRDLWSTEGGPEPLWDCRENPPRPYEVTAVRKGDAAPVDGESQLIDLPDAESIDHARDIAEAWAAANPDKAERYRLCYSHKAESTLREIPARESADV